LSNSDNDAEETPESQAINTPPQLLISTLGLLRFTLGFIRQKTRWFANFAPAQAACSFLWALLQFWWLARKAHLYLTKISRLNHRL